MYVFVLDLLCPSKQRQRQPTLSSLVETLVAKIEEKGSSRAVVGVSCWRAGCWKEKQPFLWFSTSCDFQAFLFSLLFGVCFLYLLKLKIK